jgi:hypothetical protein
MAKPEATPIRTFWRDRNVRSRSNRVKLIEF